MLAPVVVLPAPAETLLVDGSIAVVRPVLPTDAAELHRLHRELSDDSLRLRFFSAARGAAQAYVDHLLRDGPLTLVLEQDGRLLALSTAEPVRADVAEVSFVVEDGRHGLGIATLLLEHLAAAARERGVTTFQAQVLVENHAMQRVLTDAGFTMTRAASDGVADVTLDLTPSHRSAAAADARERRAEAASLDPLLHPHSVAVVGVRGDGTGEGRVVLENIVAGGFRGELFVVDPRLTDTPGARVVQRFADLPHPVDLAIIAVPARQVLAAVSDAAEVGVPAVLVLTSGFRELGPEGVRLQHEVGRLARASGIRLVGPDSPGVVANAPEVSLNATLTRCVPVDGGLAVAVQSTDAGARLTTLAAEIGLGVGSVVSLGDRVDVSLHDLLSAWTDDPRVTAAALCGASFGNPRAFARLAQTFSERKPLLAVVGGHPGGGRQTRASHPATSTAPDAEVAAVLGRAGVIVCPDTVELAETALLLTREPLPVGRRVGTVTNAGGAVGTSHPGATGRAMSAEALAAAVDAVLGSGEVDAVVVDLVGSQMDDPASTMAALGDLRRRHPDRTCVVAFDGVPGDGPWPHGLTLLRSAGSALRAVSRAATYAAWRAHPLASPGVEEPRQLRHIR